MTTDSNDTTQHQDALVKLRDNYTNLVTQLGTANDKSASTAYLTDRILGQEELALLYEQDAVAARIVDRVVDDATRVSFTLEDMDKSFDFASVKSELEDLDAVNQIADAWRWSRLYGGGMVIMAVNDGRKYEEPLDLSAATKLSALTVVDSTMVMPVGFIPGLGSRAFANPEYYEINVAFGTSRARKIHKSRVIRFDGLRVPASRMIQNGGWGPSVLQRVWRECKRLGSALGYAENLLHELSVMILNIEGLRDMLCGGADNISQVKQMLETLKWGVDNLHFLGLDSNDTFTEVKRSVDGVGGLIDKFVDALVRATNMPRLIILGEQPGGLNADSKGETRAWYDSVDAERGQKLTPALTRLLDVLLAVRLNRGEQVPDEFTIDYESLMSEAPEQEAQTNFIRAQTAQILVVNGLASPDEIRQGLINQGAITPIEDGAMVHPAEMAEPADELEVTVETEIPTPTKPVPEDLINVREAAEAVGVPTRTITRLIETGQLPCWTFGRHRQVSMADVAKIGDPDVES